MGLILDTSVVISAERLGQTAWQMLEGLSEGNPELAVSVITVLEMAHCVARADSEKRRAVRQRFMDDLLNGLPVFPVTIPVALRGKDRRCAAVPRSAARTRGPAHCSHGDRDGICGRHAQRAAR